jgi:integrase
VRSCLSSVFFCAIKQKGYITDNPVRRAPSLTDGNKRVRDLSNDECTALLFAYSESRWERLYLFVLMRLMTGARAGEMQDLSWSDIGLDARIRMLNRTNKMAKHVLTFPDPVIAELQWFREVGSGQVFRGRRNPQKPFDYRRHWHFTLNKAGIKNFRFHELRHSAANYLAIGGRKSQIGSRGARP